MIRLRCSSQRQARIEPTQACPVLGHGFFNLLGPCEPGEMQFQPGAAARATNSQPYSTSSHTKQFSSLGRLWRARIPGSLSSFYKPPSTCRYPTFLGPPITASITALLHPLLDHIPPLLISQSTKTRSPLYTGDGGAGPHGR